LVNGKCSVHKKKVDVVKEETYFFKLSKYQQQIIDYIKNNNFILPVERKNEILSRLKEDVRDLSISRSTFKWGIPFPIDKDHVLYVWLDALTNYISGLNDKKYWPADVHVIGKDIIWFHTVIWPAILLSAGMELPKQVFVHGFVNVKGEKLSKSGVSIDPFALIDTYDSDALRYFLLRNIPSGEDGDFSEEALIARINGELADDLGNLVNRTFVLFEKNFKETSKKEIDSLGEFALKVTNRVEKLIDNYQFHSALNEIWTLVSEANKYINEKKAWELKGKELKKVLYNLIESIRFIAILLYPFIPDTSKKIFGQLGLEKFSWKDLKFGKFEGKIKKGEILFRKVEK
jgi:methionyl-tRNA synthetase